MDTLSRANAHLQGGRTDAALALAEACLADARTTDRDRLKALLLVAWASNQASTLERSFEAASQAAALAQAQGDGASEAEARCLRASAGHRLGLGRDALDEAAAALALARAVGAGRVEAVALRTMSNLALEQDDEDEARRLLDESLACARRVGDDDCEFWALNNISNLLGIRAARMAQAGDIDGARPVVAELKAVVDEALAVAQRTGHWLHRAFALSNLADAYIVLGDHARARELVQAYAALAREGGSHRLLAYANLDEVRMWRAEGRLDEAVALLSGERHRGLLEHNADLALTTETALHEMHRQRRDFEAALHHCERASRMHVLQLTRRAEQQARVMMMRLEVEQARATAERARLDAELSLRRARLLELERDQLQRVAHEDSLTGTGNRRAADEALAQRLQDAPSGGLISVALVDLDHFKQINDRHGHAAGDAVLRTVGALMRHALRTQDRVYRYGGEEFLVILGSGVAAVAGEVCERLRLAIESHGWGDIAPGLAVTASFGLALHGAGDTAPALLERADAALYRAKREGRNRIVLG